MSVTLSELDNRTMQGLGSASDFMALDDVHNAVVQELNIRTMQARTSDINVLLGVTEEFTPDSLNYDITSLIGKAVPVWLEMQSVLITGSEWWQPVRNINLSMLNDFQRRGSFAVAFHGDEPDSDTEQATQYASFTFMPLRACRIRFDRDNQRTAMASDIILPDNLSDLVVLGAQNRLVPRIETEIAARMRNDEELRSIAPALIQGLDNIVAQNRMDMVALDMQWRVWAFRDRSAATAFNKLTPASSANYPGGRNNDSWGSYGAWGGY